MAASLGALRWVHLLSGGFVDLASTVSGLTVLGCHGGLWGLLVSCGLGGE